MKRDLHKTSETTTAPINKKRPFFSTHKILKCSLFLIAAIVLFFAISIGIRAHTLLNPQAVDLSLLDQKRLENICATQFRQQIISPLAWDSPVKNLDIGAQSVIVINTMNGDILFEKNADEVIPPASMTKLVVMYVVFQEIATGRISMDDVVPLPPESWASNAPPYSSLMFLEDGQTVTLRELLLGLAVCSGNDASVAVADYVSGSVTQFVTRMNSEIKALGLTKTHFVEPSGYDENNVTTAREFASFARTYVSQYPEALTDFHSQKSFSYPKEHNLASWHKNDGKNHTITHYNTNKALGVIEGVNGLKTGFIYESGYNISITAERNGTKLLTVQMRGKGNNSSEGNWWRVHDASEMLESAFSSIKSVNSPILEKYTIPVVQGKKSALTAHKAWNKTLTVPNSNTSSLQQTIDIPNYLTAPIQQGDIIGSVTYSYDTITIEKVPLVADRSIQATNKLMQLIDTFAVKFISK